MKLEKFKEKDKKKTGMIIFSVVSVLLLAGIIIYTSFASYVDIKSFNIISGNIPNIGDALYVYHLEDGRETTITPDFSGMILDTTNTTCTYNATVTLVNNAIVLDKTNATNSSNQIIRCDIYLDSIFPVRAVDYIQELLNNDELKQFGYDASTNSYVADERSLGNDQIWVDYNDLEPEFQGDYYMKCAQGLNLNTLYSISEYTTFTSCMNARWSNSDLIGRCVENPTTHKFYVEMNGCYGQAETLSECQTNLPTGMTCEYKPYYYGGYYIVGMDNNSIIVETDYDNDPDNMNNEMFWNNGTGYFYGHLKYNTFITSGSGTPTDPFHIELRPDAPDGTYYSYGNFPETYGYQSINDLKLHASLDNPYYDSQYNYFNIVPKTVYQNNAATSYEICLDDNTNIECFKPEVTSNEASKMQSFFGNNNCNVYLPDSIECEATISNIYYTCYTYDNYLNCQVKGVNCTIDNGNLTCTKN